MQTIHSHLGMDTIANGGRMGKHFSFVHCADLHLGEPFHGVPGDDRGPWTEAISKATFTAFERVVDAAIEAHADAILISGDIYNSSNHSLAAQMAFARELYRAAQGGIEVFIVHGNHDPDEAWRADIPLPPSVHIFSSQKVEAIPLMVEGELAATIYGISYPSRHVKDNLAREFHRKADDGFAIGMLHTDVGVKDSPYAPCSLDDLKASKMDYWALGHIHTRKELCEAPRVVYPGNTQGLDRTETGPRGCYLVDVGAYGTVTMKFIETDGIRWLDMDVDISECKDQDELFREIGKRRAALKGDIGKPALVRLILSGRGPLHKAAASESGQEFILQTLNEKERFRHIFAYFCAIEDRTKPDIDLDERRQLPDVLGDYLRAYDTVGELGKKERIKVLRKIAEDAPEMKKLASVLDMIDDDMLLRAFQKSEIVGSEMLSEEEE